ncbi:unnamed protein product, partial [Amoebophrya sp. A25]
ARGEAASPDKDRPDLKNDANINRIPPGIRNLLMKTVRVLEQQEQQSGENTTGEHQAQQ